MPHISFERRIEQNEERTYFTLPFSVPEAIESMTVTYAYPRHVKSREGAFGLDEERSIVDLGLNAPGHAFVGASGSDRGAITISPFGSSHGYASVDVEPGEWEIIVGAYKVPPEGVTVTYDIELTEKRLRLFRGDLHTHTTGSDGTLTPEQLAELCVHQKLDFVFVTNHNSWFENDHLPRRSDITVIPGVEWTHYKGHTNFLGVRQPYRNPFCVNTAEQARAILEEAHQNGALITFNHPFCQPECGWKWGMDIFPMDAVEIWNGGLMTGPNADCLRWWHDQLCAGRHLPAVGGSDFHREGPLALPGLPTTCVYALSRAPGDLLAAIRAGRCCVSFAPGGPVASLQAGDVLMGGTAASGAEVTLRFEGLRGGDVLRVVTDREAKDTLCPAGAETAELPFRHGGEKFVYGQVLRSFGYELAPQCVLVSNPIYFDAEA
ncbi:MAG: CehA/McbA family metallohydrolase [Eubacteriales bacterium]|nr:CehA/McbA family metallohydrolase [Eubacteriales bacterium]